jgi:hypothetical protein
MTSRIKDRAATPKLGIAVRWLRLIGVLGMAAPFATWGQLVPVGPEFRVNTYTTSIQQFAAVSGAPNGQFMVVWSSNLGGNQDGSGAGVFGQRYSSSGQPLGGEFQVNSYTTQSQFRPAINHAANGDFVVWQSYGRIVTGME